MHWHGHNDFGLATAAAVAAVQAGATWVHGTVNGMGERAGNANLLEIALALEALYGIPTEARPLQGARAAALVQVRSGYALHRGRRSPATTSSPARAVPSRASPTTRCDRALFSSSSARSMGSSWEKSGLDSIRLKAEELGVELPEERYAEVLTEVKELGAQKRRLLTDAEFRRSSVPDPVRLTDMSPGRDTRCG